MSGLRNRINRLEGREPPCSYGRAFLWGQGQSLAEALEHEGLSLDDKPLLAIRLVGVEAGETEPRIDPLYERDKHLLD